VHPTVHTPVHDCLTAADHVQTWKTKMTQGELLEALEKAADFAYVAPGAAVHA
jgi:hypothetical protein